MRSGSMLVTPVDGEPRAGRRSGLVLVISMFILVGMTGLVGATLIRGLSEASIAQSHASRQQAFYLAEGGLDAKIGQFKDAIPTNDRTDLTASLSSGTYAVTIGPENPPGSGQYPFTSVGTAGGIDTTISSTVRIVTTGGGGPPPPPGGAFNYVTASTAMNFDGSVTLGDASLPCDDPNSAGCLRPTIYVDASSAEFRSGDVVTNRSVDVWAKLIEFYNPVNRTLADICADCLDGSIFHAPVLFNTSGAPLPPTKFALQPYYDQALREAAAAGPPTYGYHHITVSGTTLPSGTYTGVIYIECGVHLVLSGQTIVMHNAVIVHEGCDAGISLERGGSLTMTYDGNAFAKGLAIIGNPTFHWRNSTINIEGVVMAGGSASVTSWFGADGTVRGGVIGVNSSPGTADCPGCVAGVNGPGTSALLTWELGDLHIPGATNITFEPLLDSPPGFSSGSSSDPPPDPDTETSSTTTATVLMWQHQ